MTADNRVKLLNDKLARHAADSLYIQRPYPYIRRSAMDAFRLFQDHQLQSKVVESIVDMIPSRQKRIQLVAALSSWGYLLALAVAENIEQAFNYSCNALCLGGELFPQPITTDIFLEPRETLLVDDIVHTGGTLRDAVRERGLLSKFKLTASLCVVIIDYDEMAPELRKPLWEILEEGTCEIFAVTKASYIHKLSTPLRRLLVLPLQKQVARIRTLSQRRGAQGE